MTIYAFFRAAIILAQFGCVLDMLLRGRTLRIPLPGGAFTEVRKTESAIAFYVLLGIWIALFVGIDLVIFWPAVLSP